MNDSTALKKSPIWTASEDIILVQAILESVSQGKTQLYGFEVASERLQSRTSGSCGFRWNSELRDKHKSALEKAKKLKNANKAKLTLVEDSNQSQPAEKSEEKAKQSGLASIDINDMQETIKSMQTFLKDMSRSLNLLKQAHVTIEKKDIEVTNLQQTVEGQRDRIKNLEHIENQWREFSAFADKVRSKGI
ncbi:hypothetical protein OM416_20200 [Paenibacillus sp. LS1]|uniref:hypothetical protein n=1 Tax=Paenibacillus sp. LS1 TaxID=2992120 RepID=UPI0022302564|nr:hypothetical protein [Paenibacillus sp. LS1]MCW3793919.1 hypothetical protein [Paenibacillus sp. LS1]